MTELRKKRLQILGAGGGKGGGGGRQPVEADDTLQSVAELRRLDLLCEGEIKGLVNGLESIFIDDVPLVSNGSDNFSGISVAWVNGTQHQDYIPGFESSVGTQTVGSRIRNDIPVLTSITELEADAFSVTVAVPSLISRDINTGDTNGTEAQVVVEYQPQNSGWIQAGVIDFNGKTKSRFQKTIRYELTGQGPWNIRLTRPTPDSTTQMLENETWLDFISTIIDRKLSYPNSALVGFKVDSRQFNNNPNVTYEIDGLIIRVPNNYDPETRTYSGIWDGGFKLEYSNNPAWCLYDILTQSRYGIGEYIDQTALPKELFYSIGKVCDVMVDDGFGGLEPRFTLNCCIKSLGEAFKVIQDICSVFRGMLYYGSGTVMPVMDTPKAVEHEVFGPSNVVGGIFKRQSTGYKERHAQVKVSWNNPQDQYRLNTEFVEFEPAYRRYGYRPTDMLAFGTTSRGQAIRAGRWMLLSEYYDDEELVFETGMAGVAVLPGDIIKISDPEVAGERMTGRTVAATRNSITLDGPIKFRSGYSYFLYYVDVNGEKRSLALINPGDYTTETVAFVQQTPDGQQPMVGDQWLISAAGLLEPETFRVVSAAEVSTGRYQISAVTHTPGKEAEIEDGVVIEPPITTIDDGLVARVPTNFVAYDTMYLIDPGRLGIKLHLSWSGVSQTYVLQFRKNGGTWEEVTLLSPNFDLEGVSEGDIFDFQVWGRAPDGKVSIESLLATYTVAGKLTPPGKPTLLQAVGGHQMITLTWVNPPDIDLDWVLVYESATNDLATAVPIGRSRNGRYERTGLDQGGKIKRYYWVAAIDTSGNVGEFNSNLGTEGETILVSTSDFDGLIQKSQLSQELQDLIENIDINTEELDALALQMLQLSASISDLGNQIEDNAAKQAQELAAQSAALNQRADELQAQAAQMAADLITLSNDLIDEANDRAQADTQLANSLAAEVLARQQVASNLVTETQNRINGDLANAQAISQEVQDRIDAVEDINDTLSQHALDIQSNADAAIQNAQDIVQEILDRENAVSTVNTRVTNLTTVVDGQATQISTLTSRVGDAESNIVTLQSTTATHTTQISSLTTRVGNAETRVTAVEETTVDLAQRVVQVQAQIGDADSMITELMRATAEGAETLSSVVVKVGNAESSIINLQEVTSESSLALQSLTTRIGDAESNITNLQTTTATHTTQISSLTTRVGTTETKITAVEETTVDLAQRMVQVQAQIGDADSMITELMRATAEGAEVMSSLVIRTGDAESSIVSLREVTAESATALQSLTTRVGDAESNITSLQTTTAGQATQISGLTTRVGDAESSITTLQTTTGTHTTQINSLTTRVGTTETNITSLQTTTQELALSQLTLQASVGDIESQVLDSMEASADVARRVTQLSVRTEDAESSIVTLQQVTSETATSLTTLTTRVGTAESSISTLQTTTATHTSQINTLTTRVGDAESGITNLQTTTATQATQISGLTTRVGDAESGISTLQTTTATHTSQINNLTTRVGNAESSITTLQTTTGEQATQLSTLTTRVGTAESSISTLQTTTATHTSQINTLTTRVGNAETKITSVEETTVDLAQRMVQVQAQVGDADSMITELMKATAEGAQIMSSLEVRAGDAESSIVSLREVTAETTTAMQTLTTRVGNTENSLTSLQSTTQEMALAQLSLQTVIGDVESQIQDTFQTAENLAVRTTNLTVRTADMESSIVSIQQVTSDTASSLTALTTRVTTAEGKITTAESNITTLQTTSGTQATQLSNLTTRVGTAESNITNLQTTTGTQATQISGLSTRVGTAESNITTVQNTQVTQGTKIGTLEGNVTTLTSSVTTLTGRVEGAEASIETVQEVQLDTNGKLSTMYALKTQAMTGAEWTQQLTWNFREVVPGWTVSGATFSVVDDLLRVVSTSTNPIFRTAPSGIDIPGGTIKTIRMRIKRNAGSGWNGQVLYTTSGHGESTAYRKVLANPGLVIGQWKTIEWDMSNLTAGGNDWINNNIRQLRFDLGSTATDSFDIEWISLGNWDLSAAHTVIAGIGLGIEDDGTGLISQVLIQADRFAVISPSDGAIMTPFVIQDGQTFINEAVIGKSTIKRAMIKDAAVDTAKIADLAVTNAKIGDLSVTSAKIDNLAVTTGKIQDLAVDTLKIKDRAVTVPAGYYSDSVYADDSWTTIGYAYMEDIANVPVWISFSCGLDQVTSGEIEVKVNGVRQFYDTWTTLGPNTPYVNFNINRLFQISDQNMEIVVQTKYPPSGWGYHQRCSLFSIGCKK